MPNDAIIWTEGKTDGQHLTSAARALKVPYNLSFEPVNGADMGDEQLFRQCCALARVAQPCPTIFIFDRDKPDIVSKIDEKGSAYKSWGNNVYSFALPAPSHRSDSAGVCIELYYGDEEIKTRDAAGRRVFLSSEFNAVSGRHLFDPHLSVGHKGKLPPPSSSAIRVIDSEVYDANHNNVAMSKAEFARNIFDATEPFSRFDFTQFSKVFSIIGNIIDSCNRPTLCFSGFHEFLDELEPTDNSHKLAAVTEACIRAAKLSIMIFATATIRFYYGPQADQSNLDPKKYRLIRQLLVENFTNPSLNTLVKLARQCYHLVDDRAPDTLQILRGLMADNPVLGPIGATLDDLERVLPPDLRQGRSINKRSMKKPVLEYVFPEFAKYEGRIAEIRDALGSEILNDADPSVWIQGLSMLLDLLSPLSSLWFRTSSIDRVKSDSEEFLVLLTTYAGTRMATERILREYNDFTGDRLETYEICLAPETDGHWLDMFPFLTTKADKLYYYARTRAIGYEYSCVFPSAAHIVPTKRKFSHAALGASTAVDKQMLFWVPVAPAVSGTGVKATIPAHDQAAFVGRKQQIATIMDEIIRIPNQNGLIYGPGGVGKTALLIELSRQLFENAVPLEAPFKNIIWISAKGDYYDPTLDLVEAGTQQFRSLEQIWTAILDFHEMESAEEYDKDDRKWFVIELLRQDKTLLILDNFETVPRASQEDIVRFFGVEVKRQLADKPDNSKVLLTSREIIPSGFHQIALKGLDKRESKLFMQRLDEQYRSSQLALTELERDQIYEATKGIPLIIKHCYGQIFEYNLLPDHVLANLNAAGNKVVEFSFAEIFKILKEDEKQRNVMILLELVNKPLLIRQVADILALDHNDTIAAIESLARFQCIVRSAPDAEDKYALNPDILLLATRLVQDSPTITAEIRRRIAQLSADKRLDYTKEELDLLIIFQQYLTNKQFVHAEDFIKDKLKHRPGSVLLNLHYAKYLKDIKHQVSEAIGRLELVRVSSGNHPHVLQLLMKYYIALDAPNFEQAFVYAAELEKTPVDQDIKMDVAGFYTEWATRLKQKPVLDPIKEMQRQQRYKELSDHAIGVLKGCVNRKSHVWYYLLARCEYNMWDYDAAKRNIDQAIALLPSGSHLGTHYEGLMGEIIKKWSYYRKRV